MIKHLQIGMHCLEGTEWMSEGLGKMWGSGGMRLVHMSTDPRIEICNKEEITLPGLVTSYQHSRIENEFIKVVRHKNRFIRHVIMIA